MICKKENRLKSLYVICAEISQLMHLTISAKLYILMKTRQTEREPVLQNFIGSRETLKNIVS